MLLGIPSCSLKLNLQIKKQTSTNLLSKAHQSASSKLLHFYRNLSLNKQLVSKGHTGIKRVVNEKQPPEVFYEKGVLRNIAKFTGKHQRQSLFFFIKKRIFEFCEISKNTFFIENLRTTAFGECDMHSKFQQRTHPSKSYLFEMVK